MFRSFQKEFENQQHEAYHHVASSISTVLLGSTSTEAHGYNIQINTETHRYNINNNHEFIKVGNTTIYVISAYYDNRKHDGSVMRFFGIKHVNDTAKIWCQFIGDHDGFNLLNSSRAIIDVIPEQQGNYKWLEYRQIKGKCKPYFRNFLF